MRVLKVSSIFMRSWASSAVWIYAVPGSTCPIRPRSGRSSIGHTRYDAGFVRRVAAAVHVVRQQVIGEIVVLVPALVVPQVQGRADIVLDCPESFVGIGGRRVLLKATQLTITEGEDG